MFSPSKQSWLRQLPMSSRLNFPSLKKRLLRRNLRWISPPTTFMSALFPWWTEFFTVQLKKKIFFARWTCLTRRLRAIPHFFLPIAGWLEPTIQFTLCCRPITSRITRQAVWLWPSPRLMRPFACNPIQEKRTLPWLGTFTGDILITIMLAPRSKLLRAVYLTVHAFLNYTG